MASDLWTFLATLRNPRWNDEAHTKILFDGTLSTGGTVSFLASPTDPESHGAGVYAAAVRGEYGTVGAYTPPAMDDLRKALNAAATAVTSGVIGAIEPNITRATAFDSIARMVAQVGGATPSSSRFTTYATRYGITPDELTTVVNVLEDASLDLDDALFTLTAAATAATDSTGLATALTDFMTTIGTVVATINASVPDTITAPSTPTIPGINA